MMKSSFKTRLKLETFRKLTTKDSKKLYELSGVKKFSPLGV